MRDLFEYQEELPEIVREVITRYANEFVDSADYSACESLLDELFPHGFTFDYGLDAIPCNLRKILDCK
jgi:hypothetical protein